MGIGLGDQPKTYKLEAASELTSLWAVFGGGYTFPLGDVSRLVARASYGISFNSVPVAFQSISLSVSLEFEG